jgi:hypothetical protein
LWVYTHQQPLTVSGDFSKGIDPQIQRACTEMALHVLAYNLTRVMNIMGIQPLMAAIRA